MVKLESLIYFCTKDIIYITTNLDQYIQIDFGIEFFISKHVKYSHDYIDIFFYIFSDLYIIFNNYYCYYEGSYVQN